MWKSYKYWSGRRERSATQTLELVYDLAENIKVIMEVRVGCRLVLHAVFIQLGRSILLRVLYMMNIWSRPRSMNRTLQTRSFSSWPEPNEIGEWNLNPSNWTTASLRLSIHQRVFSWKFRNGPGSFQISQSAARVLSPSNLYYFVPPNLSKTALYV